MNECLSGKRLYGDDFSRYEIEKWHKDEKEAYSEMCNFMEGVYKYSYHALNQLHGFRHLPERNFQHVLGLGSAFGDEFAPIINRIGMVTIVESSDRFSKNNYGALPTTYVKPDVYGTLPFSNDSFDLVTCFGVLHHIPNVSQVVSELARCLKPGGFALIREPIISLGDWTKRRPCLTPRERGIPIDIFRDILFEAGFVVERETLCMFPGVPKIWNKISGPCFNSPLAVRIDALVSAVLKFNLAYHRPGFWKKFGPTSAFFVLKKA